MITGIDGVADARSVPGVEDIIFRMNVGEEIRPYRTCADRVGFVITCADSRQEALDAADEAASRLRVSTTTLSTT